MVVGAGPAGTERSRDGGTSDGEYALAPDRSAIARLTSDSLQVLDVSRTHRRSVALPADKDGARVSWTATAGGSWSGGENDGLFRAYAAGGPRPERGSAPPPQEGRCQRQPRRPPGLGDGPARVDGTVARLDAATGAVLTPAFSAQEEP
ncbi:hypothetical protein ACFSNO_14210 [Streptomyces cirratus]